MASVLHGSARTTPRVRAELQASKESARSLAARYGLNAKTVRKWRGRTTTTDEPMGPKTPKSTVLTPAEEAIVVAFRQKTLLPLDDVLGCLKDAIPNLSRSALHRCLQRHGVSRLPVEETQERRKRFKTYEIGYVHIDSCELRHAQGKLVMFLAIDRANDYWAHFSKAGVLMAQNRHEEAIVQAERSLALNPSFMEAYEVLCLANNFLGRPDRTMEYADTAIRLSPRDPYIFSNYHAKGWAFFMKEQDDHAIEWLRRSAAAAPGAEPFTYLLLASAYALNGRQAEAQDELKRYLSLSRTKSTTIAQLRKQQLSLADNSTWVAYNERLFEGLRKAGMAEE